MSMSQQIVFGSVASWISRGMTIMLGLAVLPVLFRQLPKEELGLWLLLGQSSAALAILDLGFGGALTRRIAFARGRSPAGSEAVLTAETKSEVADLVAVGRRVYRLLAVIGFLVSSAAGFFYVHELDLYSANPTTVVFAWALLCFGNAFGLWSSIWTCLLLGIGYVGWDSILASFVNAITLLVQIFVALAGGGLVALAMVAACGAIVQRSLTMAFSQRRRPELFCYEGRWNWKIFTNLLPAALRGWCTSVGGAMVLYTDQFLIASSEGALQIPAYRAAFVLIHNLTIIAQTVAVTSSVFISQLWENGDFESIHRILKRSARFGLLVMASGTAYLIVVGELTFNTWLGPGNFAGYAIITTFLISETLETQSGIVATASRATGDEAFAVSAISAGILKLVLSWWLMSRFGLLGVALGTALALLLTNHWYMVYRGLRRVRFSFSEFATTTIAPCIIAFSGMLIVLLGTHRLIAGFSPLIQLVYTASATAVLFGLAVWNLILEPGQRIRVGKALGFAK